MQRAFARVNRREGPSVVANKRVCLFISSLELVLGPGDNKTEALVSRKMPRPRPDETHVFEHPLIQDLVYAALEEAVRLGASYADVHFEQALSERIDAVSGMTEMSVFENRGVRVRVLYQGAWGVVSVSDPSRHDSITAAKKAVSNARAAAVFRERRVQLTEPLPHRTVYATQTEQDALAVSVKDKADLVNGILDGFGTSEKIVQKTGWLSARRSKRVFATSDGHEVDRELATCGAGFRVTASDGHEVQTRSLPGPHGVVLAKGFEALEDSRFLDSLDRVSEEAIMLLSAEACPQGVKDVVLSGSQVAEQLQGSIGKMAELDRVLGLYAAGKPFLTLDELGRLEIASEEVSVTASCLDGAESKQASYDDDGILSQEVELVKKGRMTGLLSSRSTAQAAGLSQSEGHLYSESFADIPVVAATGLILSGGSAGGLENIIRDTGSGVLFDGGTGFFLAPGGQKFEAFGEIAWEIKDGAIGRAYKNPSYRGHVFDFWRACDAVCGEEERRTYSVPFVKGLPAQDGFCQVSALPARFRSQRVGDKSTPETISKAQLEGMLS